MFQTSAADVTKGQRRTPHRKPIRAAAATLLSILALFVTAGPAHAGGWAVTDTFDVNTTTIWRHQKVGDGFYIYNPEFGSPFIVPGGYVRVGITNGTGWSAAARDLHLSPVATHGTAQCGAQVALKGTGLVNIEVIDPTTWRYIALKQVTITSSWQNYGVDPWTATKTDVVFRVSSLKPNAGGGTQTARIDDFRAVCTYV